MARIHQILPDEFPESWASDWGEDEYGIFMGFTYKGVRQIFRWIEPGRFLMGSPEDEPERESDETQHEVTFIKGFWIADTTVTQALWEAVMDENPSNFKGTRRPVEKVSWDDVQVFINKMNEMKEELQLCLPTEAQWEYSCRAGTVTPFYFGEQISSEIVNYDGNYPYNNSSKSRFLGQTFEVGNVTPNNWGLYEMHGNVYEWCQDYYGSYPTQEVAEPQVLPSGFDRVLRGGSWISDGGHCRSAYREHFDPTARIGRYGFRLARCLELQPVQLNMIKPAAAMDTHDEVHGVNVKKDMNPYRKLMVLGLNELLMRGLLSLDWDGETNDNAAYIETNIGGYNSIIAWTGIGFGEVRISVWWKYDHNKHPQANLSGNERESFSTSRPLAKKQHYPKFVGVVCSAWLERKRGKYLQGKGNDYLFDKYTRSGELEHLKQLPNPVPLGYEPEGNFHM